MLELFKRVLVALIFVPLIVYIILIENPIFLFLFVLFLSIFAFFELKTILKRKGVTLPLWTSIFNILIILGFYFSAKYSKNFLPYGIFIFSNFIFYVFKTFENKFENSIKEISIFTFTIFYTGFLIGHLIFFKFIKNGNYFLLYIIVLCWLNDTFAYFTGTLFGKKKLNLLVSPNKSYAGVIGGIFFSIIGINFLLNFLFKKGIKFNLIFLKYNFKSEFIFSLKWNIIIGIIFGFIIIFSDLIESLLKRSAGIKDSSNLIPGHGGILDIFDSLIFTAPIFYYFVSLIL
jgi:phosphatidate cytidylyltransferase